MTCRFCSFHNPEDEERCRRCGKRLSGDASVDGVSFDGATVLAPRRKPRTLNAAPVKAAPALAVPAGAQASLFANDALLSNLIPFESIQRTGASAVKQDGSRSTPRVATARPAGSKPSNRKPTTPNDGGAQGVFDLEILAPAPQTPRMLKTTVEASIYCDAPVAAPAHRSVAALLDSAMIVIGCGLFLGVFQAFGGTLRIDKFNLAIFASAILLIPMFYGLLFSLAGRETAGQHWTDLQLINFDGFPPDGQSRALRFLGCWLSFSAGGIGLLWALVDEENLTWHDHMSKTFVTLREPDTTFFRARPR